MAGILKEGDPLPEGATPMPDYSSIVLQEKPTARWPKAFESRASVSREGYLTAPKVNVGADVAKSGLSQAALGVVADIPGMIGGVGQLYDDAIGYTTGYLPLRAAEAAGLLPRNAAKEIYSGVKDIGKSPAEKKGYVNKTFGIPFPTPTGMEKMATNIVPALGYQPKTPQGQYVGSSSRFGTSMLGPGGWAKATEKGGTAITKEALKRLGLGAAQGVGAEAGSDVAESFGASEYDPYARFAGSLSPILFGKAAKPIYRTGEKLVTPGRAAEREIATAFASDTRRGLAGMSPQEVDSMMAQGIEPTLLDIGGPSVRGLVRDFGYAGPAAESKYGQMINYFNERTTQAGKNLSEWVQKNFGGNLTPGDEALLKEQARKSENNILYGIARANPSADFVWSFDLEKLAKNEYVKKAMDQAAKFADPLNPDRTKASIPYDPSMGHYPNLNFWHDTKRMLDGQIKSLRKAGDTDLADFIDVERKKLLDQMEGLVPEYKTARNTAAELFGAENAHQAGFNAFSTANEIKTVKNISTALKQFSPENKQVFREGAASWLQQQAANPVSFVKKLNTPRTKAALKMVFGKDGYDNIMSAAQAQAKLLDSPIAGQRPSESNILKDVSFAGAGAAAVSPVANVLLYSNPDIFNMAVMAMSAAGGVGIRGAMTAAERRVAPHVLEILSSTDPSKRARIVELVANDPNAKSFSEKLAREAIRLSKTEVRANPLSEPEDKNPEFPVGDSRRYPAAVTVGDRQGRATGGRIMNHRSEADSLIRLADKTKKALNNSTESLLSVPDETVTKALSIANEAI